LSPYAELHALSDHALLARLRLFKTINNFDLRHGDGLGAYALHSLDAPLPVWWLRAGRASYAAGPGPGRRFGYGRASA